MLNCREMTNFDRILAEARELLTEEERLKLSDRLIVDEPDPAVEEAWMQEVLRRRAEWKAGRAKSSSWEEARKRIFAAP